MIVRQRQEKQLDGWLAQAQDCGITAVRAALPLPHSNGPTEGQINRLEWLQRQMYGRAKFDRLRQRFLAA